MMQTGLPGLSGLNHPGFGVPNLAEAIDFFTNVMGLPLIRRGMIESPQDDAMRRWFDVDPRGQVNLAFFRLPDGTQFEVVEWSAPDQVEGMRKNSDVAGRHIALSVTDLAAAVEYLKAQPGVTVFEPHPYGFAYFKTPFGMYIQLVQVQQ
jgi:catechol 2,3-dioxygenase-like lactoylglutathione lyase family enzyme